MEKIKKMGSPVKGDAPSKEQSKEEWIKERLKDFEEEQRKNLNIEEKESKHWTKPYEKPAYSKERSKTKILLESLTGVQDKLIAEGLNGLGYMVESLSCPDGESLRNGKEFGNRGQCNPTYYTVGNLVKYLQYLRDERGLGVEEIKRDYIFLTAGACGPCRFGMYESEYRQALKASGFEGFRVLIFEQRVDGESNEEQIININLAFLKVLIKGMMLGDIVNMLGYKIRPYEVNKGDTDKVIEEAKELLGDALRSKRSIIRALSKVGKKFSKIDVDYKEVKPVVNVIGEFWAMTTEGEGNYKIKRWLESEGAEVRIQPVVDWVRYILWETADFHKSRVNLKGVDGGGIESKKASKKLLRYVTLFNKILLIYYKLYLKVARYGKYTPTKIEDLQEASNNFYNKDISGGEGYMEVGKLIMASKKRNANMVLSVKPFGCMPSSSVSDGVQSKVQELYPDVIFCSIETSGDGAVNIYSRVQMMLHKAKQIAVKEFNDILQKESLTIKDIELKLKSKHKKASYKVGKDKKLVSTASNFAMELLKN